MCHHSSYQPAVAHRAGRLATEIGGAVRVAFLAPNIGNPGSFYDLFADVLRVAAGQLGVDLDVVDGTKKRDVMLARARSVVAGTSRPDYMLLVNYMDVGREILPMNATAGVGTFFVVEGVGGEQRTTVDWGKIGSRCLGEIVPDDVEAGRMLADSLTEEARRLGLRDGAGQVRVGLLAGEHTQAGNARFRGWLSSRKAHSDVVQSGFQYGYWEEAPAKSATAQILRTAPETRVMWCANDAMALGALAAARDAGRRPGEDIIIGGVDLVDRALSEVAAGGLALSIGGHIVDGARALILLYDHHETRDLKPTGNTTHLVAVRAPDADRYLRFMKGRAWRHVDFTRFSRRKNPRATDTPLSLHSLVSC
jgi:hypothetical protein